MGDVVYRVVASDGFKKMLGIGTWRVDAAATDALRAEIKAKEATAQQKAEEARRTEMKALAQEQINATLLALQQKADDEAAEQERRAAAQQAAEHQAEIERRSAELQAQSQQMPERITSVQTPSAIMLPEMKPAKPAGDSKVGLLVGGGVLAAIAAGIMS
jgi:hypothetical protein